MTKMHTRIKRKFYLSTHHKGGKVKIRKKRQKTFKTEETAKAYAEKHKIRDYKLVNLRSPEAKAKKLRIITKS